MNFCLISITLMSLIIIENDNLKKLSIMRILIPTSKTESIRLMCKHFNIVYSDGI